MAWQSRIKLLIKSVIPDGILFRISPTIVRIYARGATWYHFSRHYNAPIDPLRIYYINPADVNHKMTTESKSAFEFSDVVSEVVGGDWDSKTEPIEEYDLFQAFRHRFEHNGAWEDTEFYKSRATLIRTGTPRWGCDSISQFRSRLQEMEKLYKKINAEGYHTQAELRTNSLPNVGDRVIHKYWPPELHEVMVDIDRKGNFVLHEGRHRFSIARLLNLPEIPVRIKGRHTEWQRFRDQQMNDVKSFDHPDIETPSR